jgi:hypothetical protein
MDHADCDLQFSRLAQHQCGDIPSIATFLLIFCLFLVLDDKFEEEDKSNNDADIKNNKDNNTGKIGNHPQPQREGGSQ